jgi:2-polyprenyl-3-methyl-5-hydroxy-6-metoxy-1,4-benzoquinol methylase
MPERISLKDNSLYRGYANHIQHYSFAAQHCAGKSVLDAGCGTGYGSAFLITQGAASVTAIDISDEALAEAKRLYRRDNLRFIQGDVERLSEIVELGGPFDVVVDLENIEHLANPTRFLEGAKRQLGSEGALVVSTPNGQLTERDGAGKILNQFHVQEFSSCVRTLAGSNYSASGRPPSGWRGSISRSASSRASASSASAQGIACGEPSANS